MSSPFAESNMLIPKRRGADSTSVELAGPGCSRVIDVNNFQVGVEIESRRTLFTFADTGRLHPAERNLGFSSNCRRIHVNHAGLDPFTEIENAAGVIGIDRRSQTIVRSVRKFQRLLVVLRPNHG